MIRPLLLAFSMALSTLAVAHDHGHKDVAMQFHENKGQWPEHVLYRALIPGGAVFVEHSALTYFLQTGGALGGHGVADHVEAPLKMHSVKVHFEGGSAKTSAGAHKMPHYVNYFLGSDRSNWGTGCSVYAQVALNEVYPGIGLRIDGHGGMKYDWLVAKGADPKRIVMRYEGQDELYLEGGLLVMKTTAGDVIEQRPVAWQEINGVEVPVKCEYVLEGDRMNFHFPEGHDARYPLVIDPVVVFSSYTGSTGDNFGSTATYDEEGHLYGSGIIRGPGYPVTPGVVQPNFVGVANSTCDIGISKFSPDGSTLIWSTYLGGTGPDMPHSLVVNSSNELFLMATTGSNDFPVTTGCYDPVFGGGTVPPFSGASYGFTFTEGADLVVVHFSEDATSLIGSTYVGGSGNDGLNQELPLNRNYGDPFRGEIIIDDQDRPVVVTSTLSTDLFTSPDAFQTTNAGGIDVYLFRMDPLLTTMLWATYYGGSGHDSGYGLQLSSNGDIHISGGTTSSDLPMAGTPFDDTYNGVADGFIAKFPGEGGPLLASTYVGTTAYDQTYFVQIDNADDVYVVGSTLGAYPVTPGTYSTNAGMQFIHKFNSDLSASQWSTKIGSTGSENLSLTAFLVSNCGQIFISAWGSSTNGSGMAGVFGSTTGLPVTPDAYQPTTDGGDFWLAMLEPDGVALGYATFFGGTSPEHVDGGTSRFDKDGIVYHAVCAGCGGNSNYPTTPGAWSNTNNSTNCNLGVFKIDFEQNVQVDIQLNIGGEIVQDNATVCINEDLLFEALGNANVWVWDMGDGTAEQQTATVDHSYPEAGVYDVMLVGIDENSCGFSDTTFISITVLAPAVLVPSFDYVVDATCQGFFVDFESTSQGSTTVIWEFGDGTTDTEVNPSHFYQLPGTYEITLDIYDLVCVDSASTTVSIELIAPVLDLGLPDQLALCEGDAVQLSVPAGFLIYQWSTGQFSSTIVVDEPGTYWVNVHEGICSGTDTVVVHGPPQHELADDIVICPGLEVILSPTFETLSILWNTGDTTHTIMPVTDGTFTFEAIDLVGCAFQDTMTVTFSATGEGIATIPNVFSPNNDQKNDLFSVAGFALEQFSMDIYNRLGQMVFSTDQPNKGWNGGVNNSTDRAPDGTYFYVITFKDLCSTEPLTTHQGHVTLLR